VKKGETYIIKRAQRTIVFFIFSFIFIIALLNVGGYFLNLKQISVIAANAEINKYEVRSKLLMQATDEVGVLPCKKCCEGMVRRLKKRSAALQYSVMSKILKNNTQSNLNSIFQTGSRECRVLG
jgi:hypothetical protein